MTAHDAPQSAEKAWHRKAAPGTVAVVSMMFRAPIVALFDGEFWRSCDGDGPIRCVPNAITSIETPHIYSPGSAHGKDGAQ